MRDKSACQPTPEDLARVLRVDLNLARSLYARNFLADWAMPALFAACRRALAAEEELRRLKGNQMEREEAMRDGE